MNQINVIRPYYLDELQTWVFDDGNKGLVQEPFVAGIPEMLDFITADFPNAHDGFRLVFSDQEFPVRDGARSARLTFFEAETGGAWYVGKIDGIHMEGWLCPALLKYFDKPPMHLFIAASPIEFTKPTKPSKFMELISTESRYTKTFLSLPKAILRDPNLDKLPDWFLDQLINIDL
jgi:hypothetical protein